MMRRLQTNIALQFDTPPEKIEAFCEGIRELIILNKLTYKKEFHVYLTSFAEFSLNIEVILFFEVPDFATENTEKNRLLIYIIRLAKKLEIEFAYPTRTIFNYNMEKTSPKSLSNTVEIPQILGKELARDIFDHPISPKHSRSSKEDALNFTKEDI
jgi:MscS family membrane protein